MLTAELFAVGVLIFTKIGYHIRAFISIKAKRSYHEKQNAK